MGVGTMGYTGIEAPIMGGMITWSCIYMGIGTMGYTCIGATIMRGMIRGLPRGQGVHKKQYQRLK